MLRKIACRTSRFRPVLALGFLAVIGVVLTVGTPSATRATFPGDRGRVAFYRSVNGPDEIFTMAIGTEGQGLDVQRLTFSAPGEWANDPVWSPSGLRLVFTVANGDIGIINKDGSGFRKLTTGPEQDVYPTWTPDGQAIVFSSNRGGADFDFYSIDPEDTAESTVQLIVDTAESEFQSSFSPDGTELAYSNGSAIKVLNYQNPAIVRTLYSSTIGVFEPDWSPHGSHIVFETFDGGTGLFYIMDPDGSNLRLIRAGLNPSFSPDGQRIIYRDEFNFITTINLDGTIAQGSQQVGFLPNWQPLDTIVPVLFLESALPDANENGWNSTDVAVTWTCTDLGSKVNPDTSDIGPDALTETGTATAHCTDFAGNRSDASHFVRIDKVAPTLVLPPAAAPPANGIGWNRTNVTVDWTCMDDESGVDTELSTIEDDLLTASGTATATCFDKAGNGTDGSHLVQIDKVAPTITFIRPTDLTVHPVGLILDFFASDEEGGSGLASTSATLCDGFTCVPVIPGDVISNPGVYTLTVDATDVASNPAIAAIMFVVYDPSGGFVTGSGWLDSLAGAYLLAPSASGRAHFGFVSRYEPGASVPSGSTRVRFNAGDLDFNSDSYEWLVVSGARAQLRGTGTIDGQPGMFRFRLTAMDGDLSGGGGLDRLRIQIWDIDTDELVYDNNRGASDTSQPTVIGAGQIQIHQQ